MKKTLRMFIAVLEPKAAKNLYEHIGWLSWQTSDSEIAEYLGIKEDFVTSKVGDPINGAAIEINDEVKITQESVARRMAELSHKGYLCAPTLITV